MKVLVRASLLLLPLPSTAQEFEKTVSPFLQTYCVSCHGEKKAKGEIEAMVKRGWWLDATTRASLRGPRRSGTA